MIDNERTGKGEEKRAFLRRRKVERRDFLRGKILHFHVEMEMEEATGQKTVVAISHIQLGKIVPIF